MRKTGGQLATMCRQRARGKSGSIHSALYPRTQHLLDRPFKYTEQTTTTAHAGGTYFFRDAFSWLAEPLTGSDGT